MGFWVLVKGNFCELVGSIIALDFYWAVIACNYYRTLQMRHNCITFIIHSLFKKKSHYHYNVYSDTISL